MGDNQNDFEFWMVDCYMDDSCFYIQFAFLLKK